MGTPAIGSQTALAVDDSTVTAITDFDANSFRYEFMRESLAMRQSHSSTDGIRGTRSHVKDRVRIVREAIMGQIIMQPTPIELDTWIPRALGAAESTNVFALAETVPEFGVLIDRVSKRFVYTGCRVNRTTIRGTSGSPVEWTFDIEGETEVVTATVFPVTVPAIDAGSPMVFSDCTFALDADASAAQVREFEIVIDNVLDTDRYLNSVTRDQLVATDRIITLMMMVPYTADEVDLYDQAIAGGAGTLTLTNGGTSTLFTFANLKFPAESPTVQSKGEIFLRLQGQAFMSSSTRELVITHDSTP